MYISYIETGQIIITSSVQCQWKAYMNSNHSMLFFLIVVVFPLTGCGSIPTILLFYVVFLPLPPLYQLYHLYISDTITTSHRGFEPLPVDFPLRQRQQTCTIYAVQSARQSDSTISRHSNGAARCSQNFSLKPTNRNLMKP